MERLRTEHWYIEVNMCQGTLGSILTVHFYDWDKQPSGEIEFMEVIHSLFSV